MAEEVVSNRTPDPTPLSGEGKLRRWLAKALAAACVVYVMAVVGMFISNRFVADRWWPATWVMYSPRWPWVLGGVLLAALGWRRRGIWITGVVTGLFVLGPFMGFNIPWHRLVGSSEQGEHVRVLSCNVHRGELDVAKLDAYILEKNPDVVLLQDYAGWDESEVLKTGWRTLRIADAFIASKFPITHVENLHLPEVAQDAENDDPRFVGSAIGFDLMTPSGPLHVVNVHLASPHTGLTALVRKNVGLGIWKLKNNARRRAKESSTLSEYVTGLKGPVVLAGDFNMLSESTTFRKYFGGFSDGFVSRGWGYGYTHFTRISRLRLDHVLYTPDVESAGFEIGPNCGTPHRPVVADLVVAGGKS